MLLIMLFTFDYVNKHYHREAAKNAKFLLDLPTANSISLACIKQRSTKQYREIYFRKFSR